MDIIQALTVIGVAIANIGTTITLFLWASNRAAEDRNESEKRYADDRNEFEKRHADDKQQVFLILKSIQDEMKDFHGRLCAIEERNRK